MYTTIERVKNGEIQNYVENLKPFKACSADGRNVNDHYIIWSYDTVILDVDRISSTYKFNSKYYSVTTSRLQNSIKRALANMDFLKSA